MLAIALLVAGLLVLGRWAEPTKTGVLTAAIAGTSLTLLTSIAGPGPMLITCVLAGVLGTIAGGLLEGRSARRGDLEARGGEA